MIPLAADADALPQSESHSRPLGLIRSHFRDEFPTEDPTPLEGILSDVVDLYAGRWPDWQACQVGYHTLKHSAEVALLACRILIGWRRAEGDIFSATHYRMLVAAALFHDSGYLKERGDGIGRGGKFTFTHVARGKVLLGRYLASLDWPTDRAAATVDLLEITEFRGPGEALPELAVAYPDPDLRRLAAILGTADLVAQMADINYRDNITHLFEELEEAYCHLGREALLATGRRIYDSAVELSASTVEFYEQAVLPRLSHFGRVDRYLVHLFGDGRNPYLESIVANLANHLVSSDSRWQRLGTVLTSLGAISQAQLSEALRRQDAAGRPAAAVTADSFQRRFLTWSRPTNHPDCLGDILLAMQAMPPSLLVNGLLAQILPPSRLQALGREDLELLLTISVMLHSSRNDPWLFEEILTRTAARLACQGGSILLALPDRDEMIVAVSTLLRREDFSGRTIPADRGLAGWVHRHDLPAIVNAVPSDSRIEPGLDRRSPRPPESILAVPMRNNGAAFGVLEMVNRPAPGFSDADAALLSMVANITAVALGHVLA